MKGKVAGKELPCVALSVLRFVQFTSADYPPSALEASHPITLLLLSNITTASPWICNFQDKSGLFFNTLV